MTAYAETSDVLWPEMIGPAAAPSLRALGGAILRQPAQLGWPLG